MEFAKGLVLAFILVLFSTNAFADHPKIPENLKGTPFVRSVLDGGDEQSITALEIFFEELEKISGYSYDHIISTNSFSGVLSTLDLARQSRSYDKKIQLLIMVKSKLNEVMTIYNGAGFGAKQERELISAINILSYYGPVGDKIDFNAAYYYHKVAYPAISSENRASNFFRNLYLKQVIGSSVTTDAILYAHNMINDRKIYQPYVNALLFHLSDIKTKFFYETEAVFKTRIDIIKGFSEGLFKGMYTELLDKYTEKKLSVSDPVKIVDLRMNTICKIADEYAETQYPFNKVVADLEKSVFGFEGKAQGTQVMLWVQR